MIGYFFFRLFLGSIGRLPFPVLYRIADLMAFILYRVVAYRKKVILTNLSKAFPHFSLQEQKKLLKAFYKNLSDISLEGLKGMHCSEVELIKRYKFLNPELVQDVFQKGQSAIGLVAHYNNWEWGAFATEPQIGGQVVGVSKSIKNKYIDAYVKKRRAKFGATIIHMQETARALILNKEIPTLYVLIADQSPSNGKTAHWLDFLNQETACLPGPDKIARRTNYPAIYFDVQRKQRGYYEIRASILSQNPAALEEGQLTALYMKQLAQIIEKEPANWLWSHRRWKKKRL